MAKAKTTHFFSWLLFSLIGGFVAGLIGSFAIVSSVAQKPESTPVTESEQVVEPVVKTGLSTADVVSTASPSVVSIIVEADVTVGQPGGLFDNFFESDPRGGETIRQQVGGGSGFIISEDGLILTNRHVVDQRNGLFSVVFNDGREFSADVLALDPLNDIALIKIETGSDIPYLSLGNSDEIQIGQTVIAIGNALGEFSNSVTKGIVSGINRRIIAGNGVSSDTIESAIQTDAAINQGNSGGPLLNEFGEVIGINTAVSQNGQSIGFAIPINTAKIVVDSYQKYGRVVRPWLGIRYVLLNSELAEVNNIDSDTGALIISGGIGSPAVIPGSPAQTAGLLEGDIVLKINGEDINESLPPSHVIGRSKVGDAIELVVLRDGKELSFSAILEELDQELLN